MSQKYIKLTIILLVIFATGTLIGLAFAKSQNITTPTNTITSTSSSMTSSLGMVKSVPTPDKDSNGEFISALVEFKVKVEKDKYSITYPQGKFTSDELKTEIQKILAKTDMSETNRFSLLGGVILNESFFSDTKSECGFTSPSSSWCFKLANNPDTKIVSLTIQKGKFI